MTIQTIKQNQVIVNTDFNYDGKTQKAFFSYDTGVIKIDYENMYNHVLNGFDYSVTTNKYTNIFLGDYCHFNFKVVDIKKAIENNTFKVGDFIIVI